MSNKDLEYVLESIDNDRSSIIETLSKLISIPAIAPELEGSGEWEKAAYIEQRLDGLGIKDIIRYNSPDDRVKSKARPNLAAMIEGRSRKGRLVLIAHMDVVPPGDRSLWISDPFTAVVKEGRIYGRGTEDNGQSLTALIHAAAGITRTKSVPEHDIALVFVSDEEVTSEHGIGYLIEKGFFRPDDIILVLDHGTPDGRLIEVSEKSILWVKVTTTGQQAHASMPDMGNNALRAGMQFGCRADEALHSRFDLEDSIFDRPYSTFEPTKKEANVPNINTVPGEDVFYMDCRLLPTYKTADVMEALEEVAAEVASETGVHIQLEAMDVEEAAPPTPKDAPVVKLLTEAVDAIYHNEPYAGGIGGGTCAALLRKAGLKAAVWETVDNMAHSANEYAVVNNLIGDCKVLAALMLGSSP